MIKTEKKKGGRGLIIKALHKVVIARSGNGGNLISNPLPGNNLLIYSHFATERGHTHKEQKTFTSKQLYNKLILQIFRLIVRLKHFL